MKAHYQTKFKLINDEELIEWEIPGYVHVDGYRYSPIFDFFRSLISIIVRESRI